MHITLDMRHKFTALLPSGLDKPRAVHNTADNLGLVADSPVHNTDQCFSLGSTPSCTYNAETSGPRGQCLGLRGRQLKGNIAASKGSVIMGGADR